MEEKTESGERMIMIAFITCNSSVYYSILAGVRVCLCLYTRVHTHKLLGYLM